MSSVSGIFDVTSFGARGDGRTLDTAAIHAAIAAAHAAGGGVVHFPAGTYLTASIRLQSRITLSLGPGAVLEAAPYEQFPFDPPEPEAAPDAQKLSHFGNSHWRNSLISGMDLADIAIVGPGRIFGKSLVRTPSVPEGAANKAIALVRCRNVILRDFSILQGGHFAILASGTDNLTVDHVTIDTQRDGMDFDGCCNVRIANCSVNSPFDDGICLKSSAALGHARATENVTITNCLVCGYDVGTLLDGTRQRRVDFTKPAPEGATGSLAFGPQAGTLAHHGGPTGRIKLGTESFGGFKNITISNCVFEYCRGLALEAVDGGVLEDITVTNLTLRDIANAPIFLRLGNRRGRGYGTPPVSVVRRVVISNLVASNIDPRLGCLISGIPGHPIEDITLSNIRILYRGGGTAEDAACEVAELEGGYPEPFHFGRTPAYGFFLRHLRGVTLHAIDLRTADADARPPFVLDDVADVRFSHVNAARADDAPLFVLKNVSGLTLDRCAGIPDFQDNGAIASAALPAGRTAAPQPLRLFVVGDSISMHYGPPLERRLAPRFTYDRKRDDGTGSSADLDNPEGANGGDSRQVLEYLRRRRERHPIPADILLLNCGLHDLRTDPPTGAKRVPLVEYAENLRAILAEAAAMNLAVVWVRTTPVIDALHNARCQKFHRHAADVDAYNRAADEVMTAAGVPVLDLHGFSRLLLPAGLTDHVHYNETSRELQAAFLATGLLALADAGNLRRSASSSPSQ
ncbi:MAG TPA: glycosyl hydrolase family 28-related protein [Opitutus sp.]|nr:glycosyl hydrolase family 28-related protein [Opitutus sp.]